jgi:hypothetical protein
LAGLLSAQEDARFPDQRMSQAMSMMDPIRALVWDYEVETFSAPEYDEAVQSLVSAFEEERGFPLAPGPKGKVGLKVYTNSGPGISTPLPLVDALIRLLQDRGFVKKQMFIVDLDAINLRESGFLPRVSNGDTTYNGVPVLILESGEFYDPLWFYDNPLPASNTRRLNRLSGAPVFEETEQAPTPEDRKSYLPTPLLLEVDFWINLPMVMDHPALGISGALTNPTLWNVSNNRRFFLNRASAPAAATEIAAIPELYEGWVFTILTLENYQFIGGPLFNSLYTKTQPRVLLSKNPVILDYIGLRLINRARREHGFDMVMMEQPLFYYAETLGLGQWNPDLITTIDLP